MKFLSNNKFLMLDIVLAMGLMAFHMFYINNGSTDPKEPGFYISIFFGISVVLLLKFMFNKTFFPTAKYISSKLLHKINIKIDSNEEFIKEAGANHLLKREGVGGKLLLTDKRLIFKSHQFNIQNHEEFINLNDIKDLKDFSKSLLKNGLMVELYNNVVHKFIVDPGSPSIWIEEINRIKEPKLR